MVGYAGHRSVLVHDLADDAGRVETCEPGKIDGRFGLADALEHATGLRPQGEDVTGLDEVARLRGGRDCNLDRVRAIGGRDPGRHALARLDRLRERGSERRLVALGHRPQAELVCPVGREAETDQAAGMRGHEVDRLGSRELGRDHEIALVLPVGVVDDDDEAAFADVFDRGLDRREGSGHCHV